MPPSKKKLSYAASPPKPIPLLDWTAEYPIVGVPAPSTANTHAGGLKIIAAFLESRSYLPMSPNLERYVVGKHTPPEQLCTVSFFVGVADFIAGRVKKQGDKHKYSTGSCLQHLGSVKTVHTHDHPHTHTHTHTFTHIHRERKRK